MEFVESIAVEPTTSSAVNNVNSVHKKSRFLGQDCGEYRGRTDELFHAMQAL
jgi:hypothetical protein